MGGKLLGEQLIMKSIAILYFHNVVELEKIQKRVTEMIMEMEELPNRERLKRLGPSAWRGEPRVCYCSNPTIRKCRRP